MRFIALITTVGCFLVLGSCNEAPTANTNGNQPIAQERGRACNQAYFYNLEQAEKRRTVVCSDGRCFEADHVDPAWETCA
jgi:hypothetical protein